ncbi:MAG: methyltransferase [Zetaproteobacteria bacterium]|nr:MAG: methyltransferase [Zetaproteobacteria bacterium]
MNRDITCICGSTDFSLKFAHDKPAPNDKVFFPIDETYKHEIHECARCGHHVAWNSFDESVLYDGQYVQTTYGDKLKATFDKIINLPSEQSDNAARVDNILRFCDRYFMDDNPKSVMDVGSGLCVFLHQMRKHRPYWNYIAVDPDPVQSAHARDVVGVEAIQSDFMALEGQDSTYDFISFNKVLEHVPDPVAMLAKSKTYLNDGGLVYVELPDATQAALEGADRQEFFVEHICAFSMPSIIILAERAGFVPLHVERIRDPSKKYTLRAFMNVEGQE